MDAENKGEKRGKGKKKGEKHTHSPAREKFYVFQAFRDDMIDGLCYPLNEEKKTARNSESEKRVMTLYSYYLKALRKDRSLIHLGEQK